MKTKKEIPVGDWVKVSGYDAGGKDIDQAIGQSRGRTQSSNVQVSISSKQTGLSQEVFFVKESQIEWVAERDNPPPFTT